jgi:hypothetical protein
MWKRTLTAGLLVGVGVGVGVAGTLAWEGQGQQPLPQARSYDTAGELIFAMRENGVTCTPVDAWGKYPVPRCQLPNGGPILAVRSVPGGWFTGGMPVAPALVGPNWVVSVDETSRSDVLARVQKGLGGELFSVPGVPAGPATVVYR